MLTVGCGRLGFDSLDTSGGDASSDTNGATGRCGEVSLMTDDFMAPTLSPRWFSYVFGGTLSQGGGELVATFPPSTSGSLYIGAESVHFMDFRDARMYVRVRQVLSQGTQGVTRVQMVSDIDNYIELVEGSGMLYGYLGIGAGPMRIASVPYDPVAHAWWQLRESQGTVYFETSMDGQ